MWPMSAIFTVDCFRTFWPQVFVVTVTLHQRGIPRLPNHYFSNMYVVTGPIFFPSNIKFSSKIHVSFLSDCFHTKYFFRDYDVMILIMT